MKLIDIHCKYVDPSTVNILPGCQIKATDSAWALTHLPLDKMDAISQTIFSDAFSFYILNKISINFFPKGPIDINAALI